MRKTIIALAPLAVIFMAAAPSTQAATNAQMTITGDVVASTCDVTVSTSNLDLGNHKPADFTAAATPVAASIKKFTVGLSDCDAPAADKIAGVTINGQTLGGNPDMFNTTGTNTGVMLKTSGSSTYVKSGETLDIAVADSTAPVAGDFNGKTLAMEAGLASSSTTADIGHVSAPIIFSFSYR